MANRPKPRRSWQPISPSTNRAPRQLSVRREHSQHKDTAPLVPERGSPRRRTNLGDPPIRIPRRLVDRLAARDLPAVEIGPSDTHQRKRAAVAIGAQRREVMQWLDRTVPEIDFLVTPPARTFLVEEIGAKPAQTALAL